MTSQQTPKEVQGLHELPPQIADLAEGKYVTKCTEELTVSSDSDEVKTETWFKSPPLDNATIRRIKSVQLFAESHDQGYADETWQGNWTWLDVEAHTYGWDAGAGKIFDAHHDLLGLLEDGNVISVRLCARFPDWEISARTGYLLFDIGHTIIERGLPSYEDAISDTRIIHNILSEVNTQTKAAFQPTLPNFSRADEFEIGEEHSLKPLRVLSLDGGGVRGLSALRLLKAVMDQTTPGKKPCEIFDMIGGTSTGGLIAIMLGRLELDVQQCIDIYKEFLDKIFDKTKFNQGWNLLTGRGVYDSKELEAIIKGLIEKIKGADHVDDALYDKNGKCKVFVMAVREKGPNNCEPVFLRSYGYGNSPNQSPFSKIKIWEAARATSAAPFYFKPLKFGDYQLIDGGLEANNPLGWLWTEVVGIYGPACPSECFLSIGTGISPNSYFSSNLLDFKKTIKSLISIATETERTHLLFRALIEAYVPKPMVKKYWRLNVSEKDGDDFKEIGDLADLKMLDKFMKMTETYLKKKEVEKMVQEAAEALSRHSESK